MAAHIHVVSKQDVTKHESISVDLQQPPLAAASVRARTRLIGITSNNFSYASLGTPLRWWDTYPVPAAAPAPHNNQEEWGIVPAWGFGEVLETNVAGIPKGACLWGFWPTSSHVFDLKLEAEELHGHYKETSEHRSGLMTLYNEYQVVKEDLSDEAKAWKSSNSIWSAGYLMNRFTFAESNDRLVHPFGMGDWTAKDADLSSAVVVVLSASSKTGRSCVWNLGDRAAGHGPLAVVQVTSNTSQSLPLNPRTAFESKTVSYADLTTSPVMEWVAGRKPARIVVLDIASPAGTVQRLHEATLSTLPDSTAFTFVGIGGQPKKVSEEDQRASVETCERLGRLQFNASPVRDAAKAIEGPGVFFQGLDTASQRWIDEKGMGDMELQWGSGIAGPNGVGKAWEDLCSGRLPRDKALVYRLP